MFAGCTFINLVFCVLLVPETKGKTLQEITAYFGGPDVTENTKATKATEMATITTTAAESTTVATKTEAAASTIVETESVRDISEKY